MLLLRESGLENLWVKWNYFWIQWNYTSEQAQRIDTVTSANFQDSNIKVVFLLYLAILTLPLGTIVIELCRTILKKMFDSVHSIIQSSTMFLYRRVNMYLYKWPIIWLAKIYQHMYVNFAQQFVKLIISATVKASSAH